MTCMEGMNVWGEALLFIAAFMTAAAIILLAGALAVAWLACCIADRVNMHQDEFIEEFYWEDERVRL